MILILQKKNKFYAIEHDKPLSANDLIKLRWLFDDTEILIDNIQDGLFVGTRKELITPWSTNAVEITRNMNIVGIKRIEEFIKVDENSLIYDPMLQNVYKSIDQNVFIIDMQPKAIEFIDNIYQYNQQEGLALSNDEIQYLNEISQKINRKLTDSEVFGFSQVNSEHCRHKIFNGTFFIDSVQKNDSLFDLIKNTTNKNPNKVVSAYKDNVAFIKGPQIEQFAPLNQEIADYFQISKIDTVLSLKAETHNFPTTVEPFNGAATGAGGEIRDRMAGGKASVPMAGTAVYMTSYPRLHNSRSWENNIDQRDWLYQSPLNILIKASNGASDFGNKFGQPLICGSVLTFEHSENGKTYGFDKVIMLAGGIGYAKKEDCIKDQPEKGDMIILLGGDNYRIGMGGGAVSSVATGEFNSMLELNAVQRANPEMQKRVFNTIRAYAESLNNPIISIHDHGAGGHLNCLSELVTDVGGKINMDKIPIGDVTLSDKEIIGNESQERMGLVLGEKNINSMQKIADRERAPMYILGEVTGDNNFSFINNENVAPIDINLDFLFGKPPKTILKDQNITTCFKDPHYNKDQVLFYIEQVLQLESVACKDWLTNKVDRSVTGKIAKQQTTGTLQLPLNNLGAVSLDFTGTKGIATSIGHNPIAGLIDSATGSLLSVAEALTNLVWAPIDGGLSGVSLSANWMWPCKNTGEDARLYNAVKAISDFAITLGINIPTGKDSLSMIQKYPNSKVVYSPGTVIISTIGEIIDINKIIEPTIKIIEDTQLLYIDFSKDSFKLGGSSLNQILNSIGENVPTIMDPIYFKNTFNSIQKLINDQLILSGHDISSGGLITALLEMNFPNINGGMDINLNEFDEQDLLKLLFCEKPGIIIQIKNTDFTTIKNYLQMNGIIFYKIGSIITERILNINLNSVKLNLNIDSLRDIWYKTSYLLDKMQSGEELSLLRYQNYKQQPLKLNFLESFKGKEIQNKTSDKKIKAAIIREKGINGDREMAFALHYAGFQVKDVHMTDLIAGRETLEELNFIVFPGGFSNSDVLGSAKGWAGAFLYNDKAKTALTNFYNRQDTLSLGVCNGCQLIVNLDLIYPNHQEKIKMLHNNSNKFESSFLSVDILNNNSVMLHSLSGSQLGIWVAHGEGKFQFPYEESKYNIPMKFNYSEYPGNPNGSNYNAAAICSNDGRHLAMMPHLERSIFPWQWAYYPSDRKDNQFTPWIEAFINAREWIKDNS